MTLSDYLSESWFPLTTQPRLTAQQQFKIDTFNHDQMKEYLEQGGHLDDDQQARWKELQEKVAAHPARLEDMERIKVEAAAKGGKKSKRRKKA
jgi:hypothetical protein